MDAEKVKEILQQAVEEIIIHGGAPQDAVKVLTRHLPGMNAPVTVLVVGESASDVSMLNI